MTFKETERAGYQMMRGDGVKVLAVVMDCEGGLYSERMKYLG